MILKFKKNELKICTLDVSEMRIWNQKSKI